MSGRVATRAWAAGPFALGAAVTGQACSALTRPSLQNDGAMIARHFSGRAIVRRQTCNYFSIIMAWTAIKFRRQPGGRGDPPLLWVLHSLGPRAH